MPIRDILVHMDSNMGCSSQVDVAIQLAGDHDAHLTGFYTDQELSVPSYAEVPIPAVVINEMQAKLEKNRTLIESQFLERIRRSEVKGEWRYAEGDPVRLLNLHARYVDLVVCGQPGVSAEWPDERTIGDEVALQCGRPVLVVPDVDAGKPPGKRIYVGWNGSREATRAISDALPLLQRAEQVKVVAINVGKHSNHGEMPCADMALHLARHDVPAVAEQLESEELNPGELLLTRVEEEQADLIVMGAYGHSRFRELVFGGVTRHVLQNLPVPVLLSH